MIESSLLMSVYFKEQPEYLRECLNSIRSSTIHLKEVVIVKDGVIPDQLEVCLEEFKLNYSGVVKILGYQENRGLGRALNYGLQHCSYDIVFRSDTDDINRKYRFEQQYAILRSDPDISILGGQIEEFTNQPGDLFRFRDVPLLREDILMCLKKKNPFNHMTVAFRKSHVEECGSYIDMSGYEDYYLWFRLLSSGRHGLNLDKVLVDARVGNNMLSRRKGINLFIRELAFQRKLFMDGYLSLVEFLRNIILRCIPRLLPSFILEFVYEKILRK